MTQKILIVGQAPSRLGDGRAFTGPSGRRLCQLFGLPDYEALASRFDLRNLLPVTQPKEESGEGDTFDRSLAMEGAIQILNSLEPGARILCAGHAVARVMGAPKTLKYYRWLESSWRRKIIWLGVIPHPSGTSRYWNEPQNFEMARRAMNLMVSSIE